MSLICVWLSACECDLSGCESLLLLLLFFSLSLSRGLCVVWACVLVVDNVLWHFHSDKDMSYAEMHSLVSWGCHCVVFIMAQI